jgi:hypothetical protein
MVKSILYVALAIVALSSAQLANVPHRLRNQKVRDVTASKSERGMLEIEPEARGKDTFEGGVELSMSMIFENDPTASPTTSATSLMLITPMPSASPTAKVTEKEESRWICSFCPVYVCRSCSD